MKQILLVTGFVLMAIGSSPALSQQSEWWSDDGVCIHALRRAEPGCDYLQVLDNDGVLGTCSCSLPARSESIVVDSAADGADADAAVGESATIEAVVESAPIAAATTAVRCRQIVVGGRRYQVCR